MGIKSSFRRDDDTSDGGKDVDFDQFLAAYTKLFEGVTLTPDQASQLIAVVKGATKAADEAGDEPLERTDGLNLSEIMASARENRDRAFGVSGHPKTR